MPMSMEEEFELIQTAGDVLHRQTNDGDSLRTHIKLVTDTPDGITVALTLRGPTDAIIARFEQMGIGPDCLGNVIKMKMMPLGVAIAQIQSTPTPSLTPTVTGVVVDPPMASPSIDKDFDDILNNTN